MAENDPVPVPDVTVLSAIVGAELASYARPRSVTLRPPLLLTFPPDCALEPVIDVAELVLLTVGEDKAARLFDLHRGVLIFCRERDPAR